jgi:hypothetical protein
MAISATAYKSLAPNEYTVTPFRTYASHMYVYVSGSIDNSDDVQITFGEQYDIESGLRVENESQELFDSVVQTFYSPIPYAAYGIQSFTYHPTESVYVISVTQDIFGEEITPGTFTVRVGTSASIDDGFGNLIVSESGVGYYLGRIFYDKGIAVVQPTSSIANGGLTKDGLCIVQGTTVNVQFTSSVQLFEHNVKVKINPTEFLYSTYNPSAVRPMLTGSLNINGTTTTTPLELMTSRSVYPFFRTDNLIPSQSLYPYITTIGLYNQDNELLAVAKLSNPIQRTDYTMQTFVVKFDT